MGCSSLTGGWTWALTREWIRESPNHWESSCPCFIWQEYLLSFWGYCMFYGQEYLLSKDTTVCFFLVFLLLFALIYFFVVVFLFACLFLFCLIYVNGHPQKSYFFSSLFMFRDKIPKSWMEADCVGKKRWQAPYSSKGTSSVGFLWKLFGNTDSLVPP